MKITECQLRQIIRSELKGSNLHEQTKTELSRFIQEFESIITNNAFKSKIRPAILHIFSGDEKDAKPIDFQALGHVLFDLMKSPNETDINDICNLLKRVVAARKGK